MPMQTMRRGPVCALLLFLTLQFFTGFLLQVACVFIVATLATVATGDSAPEVVLVIHLITILSGLQPFDLQQRGRTPITVGRMARTFLSSTERQ